MPDLENTRQGAHYHTQAHKLKLLRPHTYYLQCVNVISHNKYLNVWFLTVSILKLAWTLA